MSVEIKHYSFFFFCKFVSTFENNKIFKIKVVLTLRNSMNKSLSLFDSETNTHKFESNVVIVV